MRYIIAIHSSEAAWDALPPEQLATEYAAYGAYTEALKAAGVYVSGEQLHPVASAKLVRVNDAQLSVVDGPYAETKEQFGGFYLIDAATEAEAISWAAKCPGARHGVVELRACFGAA